MLLVPRQSPGLLPIVWSHLWEQCSHFIAKWKSSSVMHFLGQLDQKRFQDSGGFSLLSKTWEMSSLACSLISHWAFALLNTYGEGIDVTDYFLTKSFEVPPLRGLQGTGSCNSFSTQKKRKLGSYPSCSSAHAMQQDIIYLTHQNKWTCAIQLSDPTTCTQNHSLLTPSFLGHWRIKAICLSDKRSDVILALGVTQRVSDLWKCHRIDFIQMFTHSSVYRQNKWMRSITQTQPVRNRKLEPAFHSEVIAFLSFHICSGSYLLFLQVAIKQVHWERDEKTFSFSF